MGGLLSRSDRCTISDTEPGQQMDTKKDKNTQTLHWGKRLTHEMVAHSLLQRSGKTGRGMGSGNGNQVGKTERSGEGTTPLHYKITVSKSMCHNLYTCNHGRMNDYDERNDYSTATTAKDNCNPAIKDLETTKIYCQKLDQLQKQAPTVKPIGGVHV